MREIKFRAWDIENQKWLYFRIDRFPSEPQVIKIPKQVKIHFSTGLLDKNSVEIYEGDIFEDEDDSNKWEVVFENCEYFGKLIGNDGERSLSIRTNEIEIIGNIYENPELLTPPKA